MRPAIVSGIVTGDAPVGNCQNPGNEDVRIGSFSFSSDFAYDPVT